MEKSKIKKICIIVIPLLICSIIYFFLPDQIPKQFHVGGETSYMSKEWVFLFGFLPYAIYLRYKKKK